MTGYLVRAPGPATAWLRSRKTDMTLTGDPADAERMPQADAERIAAGMNHRSGPGWRAEPDGETDA